MVVEDRFPQRRICGQPGHRATICSKKTPSAAVVSTSAMISVVQQTVPTTSAVSTEAPPSTGGGELRGLKGDEWSPPPQPLLTLR